MTSDKTKDEGAKDEGATPRTTDCTAGPADAARLGGSAGDTTRADLPAAALRALQEAEERRRAAPAPALPRELGGRDGPEPVRYGDWEKKGLAIDF